MTVQIKVNGIEKFIPFEVTCSNCDSVLIVDDVKDCKVEETEGQGEMGGHTYVTIKCPACNQKVNVPDKYRNLIIKLKRIRP